MPSDLDNKKIEAERKKKERESDPVWNLIRQGVSKAEAIALVAKAKAVQASKPVKPDTKND